MENVVLHLSIIKEKVVTYIQYYSSLKVVRWHHVTLLLDIRRLNFTSVNSSSSTQKMGLLMVSCMSPHHLEISNGQNMA